MEWLSHIFVADGKKCKKNICKTYTHPPHRRLRKQGANGKTSKLHVNEYNTNVDHGTITLIASAHITTENVSVVGRMHLSS